MRNANTLTRVNPNTERKLRKVNNMIAIYKLRRDNLLEDFDRSYSHSYAKVDNLTCSSDSSSSSSDEEEVVTTEVTEETKTVTTVEYSDDDFECPTGSVCPNVDPSEIPRPTTPFDPGRSLEFTILNDSIVGLRSELTNIESTVQKCFKAIEEVNSKLDFLYNMLDGAAEYNRKSATNSWGTTGTDSKTWSEPTTTNWGIPNYKPTTIEHDTDQEEWNRWDNEDFLKW